MTTKVASPKHYRNGPDMDVAMCGTRGPMVRFEMARGRVTCLDCLARLDKAISGRRNKREFAAMVKAAKVWEYKGMGDP